MMERRGVQGTVTYLEKVKLLQSNLLAAHTVWVNDEEVFFLSILMCTLPNLVSSFVYPSVLSH